MAIEDLNIYIPTARDRQYIARVSEWTQAAKTMLPKSCDEIQALFSRGWSVLLRSGNIAIAHAAITFCWPDDWHELGGVVVHGDLRGLGLGRMVVAELNRYAASEKAIEKRFALCNRGSLPLFEAAGGDILTDIRSLPQEIWSACTSCPTKPVMGCCDTTVIMRNTPKNI